MWKVERKEELRKSSPLFLGFRREGVAMEGPSLYKLRTKKVQDHTEAREKPSMDASLLTRNPTSSLLYTILLLEYLNVHKPLRDLKRTTL